LVSITPIASLPRATSLNGNELMAAIQAGTPISLTTGQLWGLAQLLPFPLVMQNLPITTTNEFPLLDNDYVSGGIFIMFVNDSGVFMPIGASPPFSVVNNEITWLSTIYSVTPGAIVNVIYQIAELSLGGAVETYINTRAQLQITNVPSDIPAVVVFGYANVGDGGGGTYYRLVSPPSPILAGNVQSADGGWWALVSNQPAPVEAFGVLSSNADNTSLLNTAITWMNAQGGGILTFSEAAYTFLGTITCLSNVTLQGSGFGTNLTFGASSSDCIVAAGTAPDAQISGVQINNMSMTATARTGGRLIYFAFAFECYTTNLIAYNVQNGIQVYASGPVTTDNVIIQGALAQWGFYYSAAADGSNVSDTWTITNSLVQGLYSGADGM
jgi:hypothetical protein